MINEFKGEYRFLSNFYMAPVTFESVEYPSSEHAYMAAKTTHPDGREWIRSMATPGEAKKAGRKLRLRPDWEQVKQDVMYQILMDKFTRHPMLQAKLLATGNQELIEGNWWGDKIWGVCLKTNQGQNLLGKLLMKVRGELKGGKWTVVNRHHKKTGEYIGRGTPLGNQWSHMDGTAAEFKVRTRYEAIEKYKGWLKSQIRNRNSAVCGELHRLYLLGQQGPINLQCSCKPAACHGDVIVEVLNQMRPPKMLYYAGIGSRQTPDDVLQQMESIGAQLADVWTVRSGFADGADKAFCMGAENANGAMENFIPWQGFNGAPSSHDDERFVYHQVIPLIMQAAAIAEKFHPNWAACSPAARSMHTRNVFQVLGRDLQTHSHMVVCWTPRGSGSGGTGQAIRIARGFGIPVFDLAIEEHKPKLCAFVELMERQNFEDSLPW
ncbi:Swarming motility protein YbiA [compost metagenome]